MTGVEFYNLFNQQSDFSYTAYLDPTKANRLFRETMLKCSDRKYLSLEDQKTFDELSVQLVSGSVYSINANQIYTAPLGIASIVANGGTFTVTAISPHNLILGDSVTFSGLTVPYNILNGQTFPLTGVVSSTVFTFISVGTFAALTNTGTFTYSKMISDYMHLEAVRCKFTEPITQRIVATSGTSPMTIRFGARTQIRSGMRITLSGMTNANYNGTWYAKQINSTTYDLYLNADLTTPSTGGVVTNGVQGAASILWYEYAKPLFNDRMLDPYEQPTAVLPKYEVTGRFLKFFPDNRTCDEITIDYVKLPPVYVDVLDTTLDLTIYYPEKYLTWIVSMAIKQFTIPLRDPQLSQGITEDIVVNK